MRNELDAAIIGHYTQDCLIYPNKTKHALGGPPAYISAFYEKLNVNYGIVSKVGPDFRYFDRLARESMLSEKPSTAVTISYLGGNRRLNFTKMCGSITPKDINFKSKIAIVSGVAGEVLPETVKEISKNSGTVFADAQGFIRKVKGNGTVFHIPLEETEFYDIVHYIDFLKMSEEESKYVNIKAAREHANLIITKGSNGCEVILKEEEKNFPAFIASEVDSTGCGDSFLGGFVYGFLNGFEIEKCVETANYFATITLNSVGVPKIGSGPAAHLKRIMES